MINRNRLITTFCSLVQIDSPSGHEQAITKFILDILLTLAADTVMKDSYGNIITKFSGVGEPLILTAHIDTVEPGRNIKPIVKDNQIQSAGDTILGADDKSGVAAILETLANKQERKLMTRPLEVVFTLSEEVGNYGAVNLDYSQLMARYGLSFDGDGSPNQVIIASPYYERFDLEIIGKSAHASSPQNSNNVSSTVGQLLTALKQGWFSDQTLRNIGIINGGQVRNTILGEITLQGEVRSFSEKDLFAALNEIDQLCHQLCQANDLKYNFQHFRENPGFLRNSSDPWIQQIAKSIKSIDLTPEYIKSYGCFDANIFADHGIEITTVHAGYRDGHTTGEKLIISEFIKIPEIILNLISAS